MLYSYADLKVIIMSQWLDYFLWVTIKESDKYNLFHTVFKNKTRKSIKKRSSSSSLENLLKQTYVKVLCYKTNCLKNYTKKFSVKTFWLSKKKILVSVIKNHISVNNVWLLIKVFKTELNFRKVSRQTDRSIFYFSRFVILLLYSDVLYRFVNFPLCYDYWLFFHESSLY